MQEAFSKISKIPTIFVVLAERGTEIKKTNFCFAQKLVKNTKNQ